MYKTPPGEEKIIFSSKIFLPFLDIFKNGRKLWYINLTDLSPEGKRINEKIFVFLR